jgi:hypothetical protein
MSERCNFLLIGRGAVASELQTSFAVQILAQVGVDRIRVVDHLRLDGNCETTAAADGLTSPAIFKGDFTDQTVLATYFCFPNRLDLGTQNVSLQRHRDALSIKVSLDGRVAEDAEFAWVDWFSILYPLAICRFDTALIAYGMELDSSAGHDVGDPRLLSDLIRQDDRCIRVSLVENYRGAAQLISL